MKADIRPFRPQDADQVAELYNRCDYGPAAQGHRLIGTDIEQILLERDARIYLVAEDAGRIVGTIGFLGVSGRRALAPHELFAGMFLLSPSHRGGLLAGKLFCSPLMTLVDRGVRTIRLEVNPANRRAMPLYSRVGFRRLVALPPDEDGYIELVSYLPGVLADLREHFPDAPWMRLLDTGSWRALRGGHRQGIDDGVVTVGERVQLRYRFDVPGLAVAVGLDPSTGDPVEIDINGDVHRPARGRHRREAVPPVPLQLTVGPLTLLLDARDGTLTLWSRFHLGPVLVDRYPQVGPPFRTGWRRPAVDGLEICELLEPNATAPAGWQVRRRVPGGWVQRTCVLDGDAMSVTVSSLDDPAGDPVLSGRRSALPAPDGGSTDDAWRSDRGNGRREVWMHPWVGLRRALVTTARHLTDARSAGTTSLPLGIPWVRGVYPPDFTDFEAAANPRGDGTTEPRRLDGLGSRWCHPDGGADLHVTLHGTGRLRTEAGHLPSLVLPWGGQGGYRVRIGSPAGGDPEHAGTAPDDLTAARSAGLSPIEPARNDPERVRPGRRTVVPMNWAPATTAGRPTMQGKQCTPDPTAAAASNAVTMSTAGSILAWHHHGRPVLASPFPGTRDFGPMTDWSGGGWWSAQSVREDPEQGVAWGSALPVARFQPAGRGDGTAGLGGIQVAVESCAVESCSVAAGPKLAHPDPANLAPARQHTGLVVSAEGHLRGPAHDLALNLTPKTAVQGEVLIDGRPGRPWRLRPSHRHWRAFAGRAAVELHDGRYLVLLPVAGVAPEILLRGTESGLLVSLLTRSSGARPETAAWSLVIVETAQSAAEELM